MSLPDNLPFREIEFLAVSSSDFSKNESDEDIVSRVQLNISLANKYLRDLRLQIKLIGVQIYRTNNDPFISAISEQNSEQMLETFRMNASKISSDNQITPDVSVVFGSGLFKNIYGLAYRGTACIQPTYSVAFVTQGINDQSSFVQLGATLAHEIGHIVNITHDFNFYSGKASIMFPKVTPDTLSFSDTSINEYISFAGLKPSGSPLPGGACFEKIEEPITPIIQEPVILFKNGNSERINIQATKLSSIDLSLSSSGEQVNYSFVNYSLLSGPNWISIDNKNRKIIFKAPTHITTKGKRKSFTSVVQAEYNGKTTSKTFVVTVEDRDTPPKLSIKGTNISQVTNGTFKLSSNLSEITIQASDPLERITLSIKTKKNRIVRTGRNRIILKLRVSKNESLSIQARDARGNLAKRTLQVR